MAWFRSLALAVLLILGAAHPAAAQPPISHLLLEVDPQEPLHGDEVVRQAMSIIRQRLDAAAMPASSIDQKGDNRIEVDFNRADKAKLDKAVDLLAARGVFTLNLVDMDVKLQDYEVGVPKNGRVKLSSAKTGEPPVVIYQDSILTGADVQSAIPIVDSVGGPALSLKFKPDGAARLNKATSANVERKIAVVLDNQVIVAPVIRDPITNGEVIVTGSGMDPDKAKRIAAIISAPPLPARLAVIERIVVP